MKKELKSLRLKKETVRHLTDQARIYGGTLASGGFSIFTDLVTDCNWVCGSFRPTSVWSWLVDCPIPKPEPPSPNACQSEQSCENCGS